MLRRRSILQTVIIFGGLIGAAPLAISAPRCSSLFETASISTKDIEKSIADIARMKIEVDNGLATGESNSAMIGMTRKLFTEKLDQLENALRGEMTREEMTALTPDKKSKAIIELDLSGKIISEQILPGNVTQPYLDTVPYHPNHVLISSPRHENNFGAIVDIRTGQIVFDFDGAYSGKAPSMFKADFTPDGYLMVSQELNQSRKLVRRVEIWKKIEEK